MKKYCLLICVLLVGCMMLSGCRAAGSTMEKENGADETLRNQNDTPKLPEKLSLNAEGIPLLRVYQVDEDEILEMDMESYLLGVLAGEMKNDWPLEALKAQAILARTFVLKFCSEKESKYEGADISTDIEEAQAYDATGINERIEQAVRETRGLVLSQDGELPYAWFHAHSGGKTALAREGLGYDKPEPAYTHVTDGLDSDQAPPEAASWSAYFPKTEILAAARECGLKLDSLNTIEIGEIGESGRAVTLQINGEKISAPEMRIALGSTKMRSTLLTELKILDDQVLMRGRGYGHGVGMPQWGAYAMAEEGRKAEEIVSNYFRDVTVDKLW